MAPEESEMLSRLQRMDEYAFEHFVSKLWDRRGWETTVTRDSQDKGIDVVATRSIPYSEKELIQAKRYRSGNKVAGPELREYASLKQQEEGVDKVVVVSTSDFTDNALSVAESTNVKCIDGWSLAKMISRLDAEDLLHEFTDTHGEEAPLKSEENAESSDRRQKREHEEDKSITLVGTGENVSAELVGLEHVNLDYSDGFLLKNERVFEGIMCAIKLFNNKDIASIVIEELSTFAIDDAQGNTYKPANLGQLELEDGWLAHGDEFSHRIETPAGAMVKYAVGFNLPSHVKVTSIRVEKFDIQIDVDHEARKRLPALPDGIRVAL